MGVMEPLGQLGHDPRGRLVVTESAQEAEDRLRLSRLVGGRLGRLPVARLSVPRRRHRGADGLEGLDDLPAVGRWCRPVPEPFQDAGEGRPAEVGHADRTEVGVRVLVDGEDRHDVGVLQAGQCLVLGPLGGGDLQDDLAARQVVLLGEIHAGERPAAQLSAEAKPEEFLPLGDEPQEAIVGPLPRTHGADEVLMTNQGVQHASGFGAFVSVRAGRLIRLRSAEDLRDEPAGRVGDDRGIGRFLLEVVFRRRGAARMPIARKVVDAIEP